MSNHIQRIWRYRGYWVDNPFTENCRHHWWWTSWKSRWSLYIGCWFPLISRYTMPRLFVFVKIAYFVFNVRRKRKNCCPLEMEFKTIKWFEGFENVEAMMISCSSWVFRVLGSSSQELFLTPSIFLLHYVLMINVVY